jgi:hypothetical protein
VVYIVTTELLKCHDIKKYLADINAISAFVKVANGLGKAVIRNDLRGILVGIQD